MVEILNGFIAAYNNLPPWLREAITLYALPLGAIFLLVEGIKKSFKEATTRKLHWFFALALPALMGIGWQIYNHAMPGYTKTLFVRDIISGAALGFLTNGLHWLFDKLLNKFKKPVPPVKNV